jgi:hypothetical protein
MMGLEGKSSVTKKRESEIASLERNIATGASQFINEDCCCHDLLD